MASAARKRVLVVLPLVALLVAGGWAALRGRAGGADTATGVRSVPAGPPALAPAGPRPRLPPPRLVATNAVDPPELSALPQGLAQDLAMFNDDQLRAELESILLSFPSVELRRASCPALPCQAEVASADIPALNDVVDAVTNRFQEHLLTEFRADAEGGVRASFIIGTIGKAPAPRLAGR